MTIAHFIVFILGVLALSTALSVAAAAMKLVIAWVGK